MVTVAAYETLLVALLVLGNLWLLLWGAYHTVLKRESAILILNKLFGENKMGTKAPSSIRKLLKEAGYSQKTINKILQYYTKP